MIAELPAAEAGNAGRTAPRRLGPPHEERDAAQPGGAGISKDRPRNLAVSLTAVGPNGWVGHNDGHAALLQTGVPLPNIRKSALPASGKCL
jgi:hypothetical protein